MLGSSGFPSCRSLAQNTEICIRGSYRSSSKFELVICQVKLSQFAKGKEKVVSRHFCCPNLHFNAHKSAKQLPFLLDLSIPSSKNTTMTNSFYFIKKNIGALIECVHI